MRFLDICITISSVISITPVPHAHPHYYFQRSNLCWNPFPKLRCLKHLKNIHVIMYKLFSKNENKWTSFKDYLKLLVKLQKLFLSNANKIMCNNFVQWLQRSDPNICSIQLPKSITKNRRPYSYFQNDQLQFKFY